MAQPYLAFEAEAFQLYDPPRTDLADAMGWTPATDAVGPTDGITTTGTNALGINRIALAAMAARNQYNLVFTATGTYHLYIRYRTDINASVIVPLDLNALPIQSISAPNTAGQYAWLDMPISYTVSELDQVHVLTLRPRDTLYVDKIVLHRTNNLLAPQLDLLSTSNASKVPATLLPNLLRYTSFEGTGGEWDTDLASVRALAGNTATNGLTGTAQHRTFPYLGENYILLNANSSTNYPRLVMDAVPLDCDYSGLEVCVRFARQAYVP
ncbi:MAG: hypothetical protein KDC54_13395, partial [Lewinella sp.]|nr:hypothetical protein [Lewinella sp.]